MNVLNRKFLLFCLMMGVLMTGCKTMDSCGVPGGSPYRDPGTMKRGEILHVPTGVTVSEDEFWLGSGYGNVWSPEPGGYRSLAGR